MEGIKEIKDTHHSTKLPFTSIAFASLLLIGVGTYIGVQKIQEMAYFSTSSQATEGSGWVKPRICDKCDEGGGVDFCKARFDLIYDELYKKAEAKNATRRNPIPIDPSKIANSAFSRMDNDDGDTPQNEESCGYCDLDPTRGKNRYGNRIMNQMDVNAYTNLCIAPTTPTPQPSPSPTPTSTPTPPNCAACDFDNDGYYGQYDATQLRSCIFTSGMGSCVNSDINGDGRVDAGDLSAIAVCAGNPTAFTNCMYADRDKNGIIDAQDSTALSRCAFVSNINSCFNKDANADGKIDAGDLSWCPLYCAQQSSQQTSQTLLIKEGWNVVSLYVEPTDTRTSAIFGSFFELNRPYDEQNNTYQASIWTYNSSTNYWSHYASRGPDFLRTLNEIHAGTGLFIYSHIPYTLSVTGTVPQTQIPPLKEDTYNLVGLTSASVVPVENIINLSQYPNARVWRFRNQGTTSLDSQNQFEEIIGPNVDNIVGPVLQPGLGYWIHLTLPSTTNSAAPGVPAN